MFDDPVTHRILLINKQRFSMNMRAIIHQAEEGGFWAEVPALPGCVSQGETIEEIRSNIREAVKLWLDCADQPETLSKQDQIMEFAV
jgi:predicted RNase H-like HicB family nuclease